MQIQELANKGEGRKGTRELVKPAICGVRRIGGVRPLGPPAPKGGAWGPLGAQDPNQRRAP